MPRISTCLRNLVLVTLVAAPTMSRAHDGPLVVENADGAWKPPPHLAMFGETLVLAIDGNIDSSSPAAARVIAVDLSDGSTVAGRRDAVLTPSYIGKLAVIEPGIVAVGLTTAESGAAPPAGGAVVVKPGTALWSQGVSVDHAGRVDLLRIERDGLAKVQSLSSPAPVSWTRFGAAVDANGDFLAVGEPGAQPGKIHLYRRDRTGSFGAVPVVTLTGDATFGSDVALLDGLMIVGAPGQQCCDGTVTLFDISGTVPRRLETRSNPDRSTKIAYGSTVSSFVTGVVIGGAGLSLGDGPTFSGGLDAYDTAAGGLGKRTRLDPGPVEPTDGFGQPRGIATAKDAIAVRHRDKVFVFHRTAGGWSIGTSVPLGDEWRDAQLAFDGRRIVLVAEARQGVKLLGWRIDVRFVP